MHWDEMWRFEARSGTGIFAISACKKYIYILIANIWSDVCLMGKWAIWKRNFGGGIHDFEAPRNCV
jgi:hypothetical protein